MVRKLNPGSSIPTFETILRGLDEGVDLKGLWRGGRQLWAFDAKNNRLLTLNDSLNAQVDVFSPANGAACVSTSAHLDWQMTNNATKYERQIDDQAIFASLPAAWTGTTEGIIARLSNLSNGTTYYWRVRVTEQYLGLCSDISSFTTVSVSLTVGPELVFPAVAGNYRRRQV